MRELDLSCLSNLYQIIFAFYVVLKPNKKIDKNSLKFFYLSVLNYCFIIVVLRYIEILQ